MFGCYCNKMVLFNCGGEDCPSINVDVVFVDEASLVVFLMRIEEGLNGFFSEI